MRRIILASVLVSVLSIASPALAGQGGVGPCAGGTPVAFDMDPGADLGWAVSDLATHPEAYGFASVGEVVAYIHATFCASNTPGG